jgi:hypothetical protein
MMRSYGMKNKTNITIKKGKGKERYEDNEKGRMEDKEENEKLRN